jgi:putative endonuclease
MFWVYMLRCSDDSFYVGHTDNLEARLSQHQQGSFPNCYTVSRLPVQLVFVESFSTRDEAFERERQIKGWNRAKKSALIKSDWAELSRVARFKYGQKLPSTSSG